MSIRVESAMLDGDDATLLSRTAAGDTAAFEALARRYEGPLWSFLRRATGSSDLADEVRNWTLLRVLVKAHQYRGGSPRSWIFRIAWRGAQNARRGRARALSGAGPLGSSLPDAGPGPDAALDAREEARRLRAALERLDSATRALLWLCVAERMPVEEAARVLRRPASTLRYQLSKALERARRELRREGGVPDSQPTAHGLR